MTAHRTSRIKWAVCRDEGSLNANITWNHGNASLDSPADTITPKGYSLTNLLFKPHWSPVATNKSSKLVCFHYWLTNCSQFLVRTLIMALYFFHLCRCLQCILTLTSCISRFIRTLRTQQHTVLMILVGLFIELALKRGVKKAKIRSQPTSGFTHIGRFQLESFCYLWIAVQSWPCL